MRNTTRRILEFIIVLLGENLTKNFVKIGEEELGFKLNHNSNFDCGWTSPRLMVYHGKQ